MGILGTEDVAVSLSRACGISGASLQSTVVKSPSRTVIVDTSFSEKRALGRYVITGFIKTGRVYRRFEEEHIERGCRPCEIEGLLSRASPTFEKYDGNTLSAAGEKPGRLLYLCRHR
ncbi:MAG: hypothetical protein HQ592_12555 [Planctomycetes bacterium]|nr:hypothetical protein [Planctomycetota bacterium]